MSPSNSCRKASRTAFHTVSATHVTSCAQRCRDDGRCPWLRDFPWQGLPIFIDRAAPAPTSRRRLTHTNNYLIVESRRPCESVSTKPTIQHIGHPRSATRTATPAPKDSQGCAAWWTMAQASSAAAAAPRIRCAPRTALPNMPAPRKYFMCSLVRCPLCRAGIRAPMRGRGAGGFWPLRASRRAARRFPQSSDLRDLAATALRDGTAKATRWH